jgi:vacuolar-type H+-ATPase subunit I/STV1
MAGSNSSMSMLVVMALGVVVLTCGLVAVHMHPEYIESVKNWFSHTASMPRI